MTKSEAVASKRIIPPTADLRSPAYRGTRSAVFHRATDPQPNGRLKPLVRQSLALGRPINNRPQVANLPYISTCTTSMQGVIIRRSTQEDPCLLDVLSPAASDSQPRPLECSRKWR